MQPIKPKWLNAGLVLVCERCYKERIPEEDPQIAAKIGEFNLRDWLKNRLKNDGHWGNVRAISTSCMDVCARGRVTVVVDGQTGTKPAHAFVVDALADREALYQSIVELLAHPRDDADGQS
ncbi:MAG: hypothetical protein ABR508_06250 [Candidatus Baltobacteraceae bacterium]